MAGRTSTSQQRSCQVLQSCSSSFSLSFSIFDRRRSEAGGVERGRGSGLPRFGRAGIGGKSRERARGRGRLGKRGDHPVFNRARARYRARSLTVGGPKRVMSKEAVARDCLDLDSLAQGERVENENEHEDEDDWGKEWIIRPSIVLVLVLVIVLDL